MNLTVFYEGRKREIGNAQNYTKAGELKGFLASHYGIRFSDHILFMQVKEKNGKRLLGARCDETKLFENKVDEGILGKPAAGPVLLIYPKVNPHEPVLVKLRFTAGAVATKWFSVGDELTEVMKWAELEFHVPPRHQKLEIYHYEMDKSSGSRLIDYVTYEDPVITLFELAEKRPEAEEEAKKTIHLEIIDPTTDVRRNMTFELRLSDTLHTMIREVRRRDPSVYFGSRYQIMMRGRRALPISGVEIERLCLEDGAQLILFLYL